MKMTIINTCLRVINLRILLMVPLVSSNFKNPEFISAVLGWNSLDVIFCGFFTSTKAFFKDICLLNSKMKGKVDCWISQPGSDAPPDALTTAAWEVHKIPPSSSISLLDSWKKCIYIFIHLFFFLARTGLSCFRSPLSYDLSIPFFGKGPYITCIIPD